MGHRVAIMKDRAWRAALVIAAVALLGGCSSEVIEPEPVAADATAAPPAAETEAAAAAATEAPTEAAPTDEEIFAGWLEFDPAEVEAAPPPSSPAELIGGAPDRAGAEALAARLTDAGHDLTGLGVHVLPIAGTEGSLLVLSFDDKTALGQTDLDSGIGETFAKDLLGAMADLELSISQVAINYATADEEGPLVVTGTFPADKARGVLLGDAEAGKSVRLQVARGAKG